MKERPARGSATSTAIGQRRDRYSAGRRALAEAAQRVESGSTDRWETMKERGKEVWEETRAQGQEAWADVAALTGYVILQIAWVRGLMALGLPLGGATLVLSFVYLGVATYLGMQGGKRNPAAGSPFEGSRRELDRSKEWIRKRFS